MTLQRYDALLVLAWALSWLVIIGTVVYPHPFGPVILGQPFYSGKFSIVIIYVGIAAPIIVIWKLRS